MLAYGEKIELIADSKMGCDNDGPGLEKRRKCDYNCQENEIEIT
jgi:hypothetical protein